MNEKQKENKKIIEISKEELLTEYLALSNFFNTLITFRLTLLGFYIAAVGLIVSGNWPIPIPISMLAIVITVALYLFELRTRILFHHIAKRAISIEMVDWDLKNYQDELPFFSRLFPQFIKPYIVNSKFDYYSTPIKILGFITFRWKYLRHSLALDMLYLGMLIFFIISILSKIII